MVSSNEELQTRLFKAEVRLESLVRWMEGKGMLSREEYQGAIANFQSFNNAIGQLHAITSIMDKVNAASEFNKTSVIKINGEDLGIQKVIEDAGGTSDFTARLVMAKLPCGPAFTAFMKQFIDPTKTPSPDALIPDQVINPQ